MPIEIYVQARMSSTRLPGKVLMPVLGKPLLKYQMERLSRVKLANQVAILTSVSSKDDEIVNFCNLHGFLCYRGSEEDVLARYYKVAQERCPEAIVRITADCPLIDPEIVDQVIQVYRNLSPQIDYVSNSIQRTFPRGLDAEIFSFKALEQTYFDTKDPNEREHVTLHMYRHPEKFRLENVPSPIDLSQYRWTVDTPEDFQLIELLLKELYPKNRNFHLKDVLEVLQQHPDWNQINRHIEQKPY